MVTECSLTTPRLALRSLRPDDAHGLFAYRSLPEVNRYQSFRPVSLSDADAFIASLAPEPGVPGTWHQLGIFEKDRPSLIGDIGINFKAENDGEVELGCTLAPEFQGRGYAVEALRAVITYLFISLEKTRVYLGIDPRNIPSRRMAARLGMRQAGFITDFVHDGGDEGDLIIFTLTAADWNSDQP